MIQYITPEQFDIARSNGISNETLKYRVFEALWDIERAITEAPKKQNKLADHIRENLKKHNIKRTTFHYRVNQLGWDEETASTMPTLDAKESGKRSANKRRRFTDETIARAVENGICYKTLVTRVCTYKWDLERAITQPIVKRRSGNEKWRDFVVNPQTHLGGNI